MKSRRASTVVASAFLALTSMVLLASSASADDAKTVRLWKAKCASCHGVDGRAKTETGEKLGIPDMASPAFQKKVSDTEMKNAILDGFKREGKSEGMDAYRDKLTPEQVDALVGYVRTFGK
jgi:mono/diheme cytochrome c family protein